MHSVDCTVATNEEEQIGVSQSVGLLFGGHLSDILHVRLHLHHDSQQQKKLEL